MKRFAAQAAKNVIRQVVDRVLRENKSIDRIASIDQCSQLQLALHYRDLLATNRPLPAFGDVEFRCFSQNGEDGILLLLFAALGTTTKIAVEICASNGIECNAANLIVNHGWTALLIDGDEEQLKEGRRFYARCPTTALHPPTLARAWITTENVNQVLQENGISGEIDLLSLDMDGVDYWIWRAIDVIQPRVVVLEYLSPMGPERSLTVPYEAEFRSGLQQFRGASLMAFVKLGREKGYRLVGTQRYGFNAFFLRSDVGADLFPEISPSACFAHPHAQRWMREVEGFLAAGPWVEV